MKASCPVWGALGGNLLSQGGKAPSFDSIADLTGLRRPLRLSYEGIAARIKKDLDTELGFTFSVGLAPTKPASADRALVYAQLAKNLENSCIKAKRYKLAAQRVVMFLRTQDFRDFGREVQLSRSSCFPNDLLRAIVPAFDTVFAAGTLYRATGVILHHFSEAYYGQLDLSGRSSACSGSPISTSPLTP